MMVQEKWSWFGSRELIGFKKNLHVGVSYFAFGKAGFFNNTPQITHPEMEEVTEVNSHPKNFLEPVYPATEKLKSKSLGGRQLGKLTFALLQIVSEKDIPENLPKELIEKFRLVNVLTLLKIFIFPPVLLITKMR